MNWLERIHDARIHGRRVRYLAGTAAPLFPPQATVLDVGCGDGSLAAALTGARPDLRISGVEVAPRAGCLIPVSGFDGRQLPYGDRRFDATLLVDVLHHTEDPAVLLREAARVSRGLVVLKDHYADGLGAYAILRFMDNVGNRRYRVPLPYRFLRTDQWNRLFADCGLSVVRVDPLRRLYPFPANLIFGRNLHFMAQLRLSH